MRAALVGVQNGLTWKSVNRTLCPCDQKVWGEARLVQGGAAAAECEARRFALYSEAAMRVLQS